ncbi:HET-domain-containing protein [Xylaria cf. heliscus]|nr:HET-domain-containing protein [Xylaria cf. heliscus]
MLSSSESDDSGGESEDSGSSVSLGLARVETLRDNITQNFCRSIFSECGNSFLPNNVVDSLVTRDTIMAELSSNEFKEMKERDKEKFIKWIQKDAPKLFLIHIHIGLGPDTTFTSLRRFKRHKFKDTYLPIQDPTAEDFPFKKCFEKDWRPWSLESFSDSQWIFLSPKFESTRIDYTLHVRDIFPFIDKEITEVQSGGFSSVYKVTIHEAHRDHDYSQVKEIIRQSIHQIRGLVDGLNSLHNYKPKHSSPTENQSSPEMSNSKVPDIRMEVGGQPVIDQDDSGQSIRHGDLKPENILRFMECTNQSASVGTLKIADMGLAKRHVVATQYRGVTSTMYGTALYEAPEVYRSVNKARSRLYDVWSIGCIMFEFILWMLYGHDPVAELLNRLKKGGDQYFEALTGSDRAAQVHKTVSRWIQYLEEYDHECRENSALGDLLKLVKTKLLVVDLPPGGHSWKTGQLSSASHFQPPPPGENKTNYRCTSEDLLRDLEHIVSKLADYTLPPLEDWEYPVDNDFAGVLVSQLDTTVLQPRPPHNGLCQRCKNMDFWKGGFAIEDRTADLQGRSLQCSFCQMLWNAHRDFGLPKSMRVRFERYQSTLKLSGTGYSLPIFSIFRSPELQTPLPIQIGFPELPQPNTNLFFSLLRFWLQDCDEKHEGCRTPKPATLPTRLIDVGTTKSPKLHLLETGEMKFSRQRYIALSHPWGDQEKHPPFSTLRKDPSGQGRELEKFKKAIPYDQLPPTFRDAVITTRALNIRFLWIDSLCIIQGEDGDFNEESKRMEDVFSSAYCVLAASRATGQHDGFLQPTSPRKYITFQGRGKGPFYVCENIDDFSGDVLEGSLNTRGWVLQERALARRTIFFTERQAYFECGQGVRCQSLTKMHNNMADFLGDPNFPNKAISVPRGLRIRYFQDLFKQYSRLNFTHIEDRPFAIEGLESRLRSAYGTDGAYGIFDDGLGKGLFHRSLLWQRGEDNPRLWFSRIVFPIARRVTVPTWSWMAYQGGIDYVDPPFDQTVWEKNDIRPPGIKSNAVKNKADNSLQNDSKMELLATARGFNVAGHQDGEVKLMYDTEKNKSDGMRQQCVVVAKSKEGKTPQEKKYYVLLVSPLSSSVDNSDNIYERVGAGVMFGRLINFNEPGKEVRIR